MLSFLSPLFLAGAAAAAVPIVLHLLKREPEARVKFAAVQAAQARAGRAHREAAPARAAAARAARRRARAAGARLRASVLRVRRGASRSSRRDRRRARHVAQHVGARASSSARSSSRRTRSPARRPAISSASSRSPTRPRSSATPAADRALAAAAIDQAAPGFGATRYRAALSAAAQALGGRRGTIVVVTDLQESGWDAGDRASVPEGATIEVADVGALPPNLAVTARAAAAPIASSPRSTTRGPRARDARVRLTIDDRPAGDATVSLGPNQSADATFAGAPRGASAAVDGRRSGRHPGRQRALRRPRRDRPAVGARRHRQRRSRPRRVLRAAGARRGRRRPTAAYPGGGRRRRAAVGDGPTIAWRAHAAVLLLSTRGLERRGREAAGRRTRAAAAAC